MLEDVKNRIYYLTSNDSKDWREMLKIASSLSDDERNLLCWAWPSEENLRNLQRALSALNIDRVLSIGCGNGLFEWLLRESMNLNVYGLEVDRLWWECQYSIKSFIPLQYYDDGPALQQCCHVDHWDFALMFCYFNNRKAFQEYLHLYEGKWVIIVGPSTGRGIHTDPAPMEPNFPKPGEWTNRLEMPIVDGNVLVVYEKVS